MFRKMLKCSVLDIFTLHFLSKVLSQTTNTLMRMVNMLPPLCITLGSGHRAFLPCDLTPPNPSEVVYLVLWYRGDAGRVADGIFGN